MRALLFAVALITLLSSANAINLAAWNEQGEETLLPFSIAIQKKDFVQGEIVRITENQGVDAYCYNMLARLFLTDSQGNVVNKVDKDMGTIAYATMEYTVLQDTKNLQPGTYTVLVNWFCTPTKGGTPTLLGNDGLLDARQEADKISFNVFASDTGQIVKPPVVGPGPGGCNDCVSCGAGTKLVQVGETYTCVPAITPDNGKCEAGEPSSSVDCVRDTNTCKQNGQILVDGACIAPGSLDGKGTINNPLVWLQSIALFVVGVGVVLVGVGWAKGQGWI